MAFRRVILYRLQSILSPLIDLNFRHLSSCDTVDYMLIPRPDLIIHCLDSDPRSETLKAMSLLPLYIDQQSLHLNLSFILAQAPVILCTESSVSVPN